MDNSLSGGGAGRLVAASALALATAGGLAAIFIVGAQPAVAQQGFGNFFTYQGPQRSKRVIRKRRATTDETSSDITIQLAVNKQGVIRGNYTDAKSGATQVVQGSVDKQTQRVAFTVGDNTTNVVETGVYNLTKDEAPCLIHFGKDRTEQWLLVRLKNPDAGQNQS